MTYVQGYTDDWGGEYPLMVTLFHFATALTKVKICCQNRISLNAEVNSLTWINTLSIELSVTLNSVKNSIFQGNLQRLERNALKC